MKKKILSISTLGFMLFASIVAGVNASSSTKYTNQNWKVLSNQGNGVTISNTYNYVITDFSPRTIYDNYTRKTRYEAYLVTNSSYVLKQNKTYNIANNASGYYNVGYVGTGTVDMYDIANSGTGTKYSGWLGTQRFISQS